MFDINKLNEYKENNRLEAKRPRIPCQGLFGRHIHPLLIHTEELFCLVHQRMRTAV